MKIERKDPNFAIYCKQNDLESINQEWACGFAALITAMRLLGDRRYKGSALVQKLKRFGERPSEGSDIDDLMKLARRFGYRAKRFPKKYGYDKERFKRWVKKGWSRHHPVLVGSAKHWILTYSDWQKRGVRIMDPGHKRIVFETWTWEKLLKFASTGGPDRYEAIEVYSRKSKPYALPPSNRLFDFINSSRSRKFGKDYTASCIVDNFSDIVREHRGNKREGPFAYRLMSNEIESGLLTWELYFKPRDVEAIRIIRNLLIDIQQYEKNRIRRNRAERFRTEVALLLAVLGPWLQE